ncbi:polyprenyl synthetase family protein [Rickettsiales bacterium LUAb2]
MLKNTKSSILEKLQYVQNKISDKLLEYYNDDAHTSKLNEAIKYSVINNGKKYRPFLLWLTTNSLGAKEDSCFKIGAVLEMLHTYSLIHDDLPSMDNDDFRHGKKSLHKQYSEAEAILAGDALLTDAFYYLTNNDLDEDPAIKLKIINNISNYLGSKGMILGQTLDIIAANNTNIKLPEILNIHLLKTANFIELAVILGGILGKLNHDDLASLAKFGKNFGLAFQIMDDIADIEEVSNINICKHLTVNDAKKYAKQLVDEAILALDKLKYDFSLLKEFTIFVFG